MTSPSWPVIWRLPLPGIVTDSMVRKIATDLCVGQPRGHPDHLLTLNLAVAVARGTQIFGQILRGDRDGPHVTADDLPYGFSAELRDFPLQPAHAGFPRIALDDGFQRIILKRPFFLAHSRCVSSAW